MSVALYARISTSDERQHLENQIQAMTAFCEQRAARPAPGQVITDWHPPEYWKIVKTYTDQDSGASDKRPGLEMMLRDAQRREFNAVVIFALSRLTRGGPARAFDYIDRLHENGVDLVSVTEPMFSTAGRSGAVLIALAAHIAEEERRGMQERVKAGLARARKEGKTLGRPRAKVDPEKLLHAISAGKSTRQIARELDTSPATIVRLARGLRQGVKKP